MTSLLQLAPLSPEESGNYGHARVRDLAFDAVMKLWSRRKSEGFTQKLIVERTSVHPATISRNLKAPGNWTFKTFGELVQALNGNVKIIVEAVEDAHESSSNMDAYDGYDLGGSGRSDIKTIIFSPKDGVASLTSAVDSAKGLKTEFVRG